ncbi:glycoside hydrolase family 16 protein [Macrophomina phaseolina]|uniref:Glycoside hydrolase family 16 protein n=1 Tax=Macrophomina phaseolina TaxID=35725 RepID=A0ABQ8GE39_9PEZI|nr:glycoside hydrolase family 16 protein [Macrophomina phaseolina]
MLPRLCRLAVPLCVVAFLQDLVSAACECGYSVNTTTDPQHAVWTDLLETDFLHLDSLKGVGWLPQVYNTTPANEQSKYGKMASRDNVIPNPLKHSQDWAGESVNGGDPGLQLVVRSQTVDEMVTFGEVATRTRADMLYGSFRIAMKVTTVPGTCAAFFWFRNNSMEVDMELLSAQFNSTSSPLNLAIHTPESAANGFDAAKTPGFAIHQLPFRPDEGFHEYRFDWLPDRVSFYADGVWLSDLNTTVPNSPGVLVINHWSNGNPNWSAGPPVEDAVLTISYVKAYFNSSDTQRQNDFSKRCSENATAIASSVCQIPDQTIAPDTAGPDGNATAKTFFFSDDPQNTQNQTVFSDWPSTAHAIAPGQLFGSFPMAVMVAFAYSITSALLA